MTIRFVHDQFRWDSEGRRFMLVEPPTLFDDPPDRVTVQAWRHQEGWQLIYTHQFDDTKGLGLLDLWSSTSQDE